MATLRTFLSQSYPPKPTFTEKELQDLNGKVLIITGGYSGVGFQLAKLVYAQNATVYLAGRRETEGVKAIKEITSSFPNSLGKLHFLAIDLSDLNSVKQSVENFLAVEERLDVLVNNAGVMGTQTEEKTAQGHEMMLGTNCIGPFLFTKLLLPLLMTTANLSPHPGSVRVLWAGSIVIHLQAPKGGMDINNLDYRIKDESAAVRYAVSKTGNLFLGSEWAKRYPGNGVLHLVFNPGNLKTMLQRNMGCMERHMTNLMLHEPLYGAYTELWAAFSPDVDPSNNGRYVIPWGRFGSVRHDIEISLKSKEEGGSGNAAQFFDFCQLVTQGFSM